MVAQPEPPRWSVEDYLEMECNSPGFPSLIVEVLSENSTADYDRGGKFDLLYSRLPSLREYMLLAADSVSIEIRRRGPTGDWTVDRYGPEDVVILESINGSFPVADFYL